MEKVEYKVIEKEGKAEDTEEKLNELAEQGWRVVCSYVAGSWFVLERTKSIGGKDGRTKK